MKEFRRIMINGEESNYEVSNEGEVRNINTSKILKLKENDNGYLVVGLYHNGKLVMKRVHRLVMEQFVPNPKNLPQVNHMNCDKTDNRVDNLEWSSRLDNMRHAFEMGCYPCGEKSNLSKYEKSDIEHVIELLKTGDYTADEISEATGVSSAMVHQICHKKKWKHLTRDLDLSVKNATRNHYIHNSIDRAIIAGRRRSEIIEAIMRQGKTIRASENLYARRKQKVKKGESIVQCTVYYDDGIEIFPETFND